MDWRSQRFWRKSLQTQVGSISCSKPAEKSIFQAFSQSKTRVSLIFLILELVQNRLSATNVGALQVSCAFEKAFELSLQALFVKEKSKLAETHLQASFRIANQTLMLCISILKTLI